MRTPSPERLQGIAEALTRLFYCLLAVAFLAAVFGSPGRGFLLLALGGCAHVARVGVEGMLGIGAKRPRPRQRSRSVQSHRAPNVRRRRPVAAIADPAAVSRSSAR